MVRVIAAMIAVVAIGCYILICDGVGEQFCEFVRESLTPRAGIRSCSRPEKSLPLKVFQGILPELTLEGAGLNRGEESV
jgi:hypothetical protein